jgi:GAF domain-containing protein
MAEDLNIAQGSKALQYSELIPQIKGLLHGETNLIANMANISAALKEQFNWLWVGFYIVHDDELVLGPFQGPVACTRIQKNKGVCGTCWQNEATIIVPNVDEFPGHIACSSKSKSEIVLPVFKNSEVIAVLDVDSDSLASFDEIDQKYPEKILTLLS